MPILFISARQSDDDVLIALSIGGDDYIKKPYSLSVLLAKVKVLLKRIDSSYEINTPPASEDTEVDLKLDPDTMCAIYEGKRVQLKAKEYALLNALYKRHDTIVKKEELFEEVWGDAFFGDSTLNVHIRKLREKLEKDPNEPALIRTVWGTGYYLKLCE